MIKLKSLLLEIESEQEPQHILVPRRNKRERLKNYKIIIYRKIQQYIKNGSNGDLNLSYTPIEILPDNLTKVGGYLDLRETPIEVLPDNLIVNGNLNLSYTPIKSLPNDLSIDGYLNLTNTPISKKYSEEQLKSMLPNVKGGIFIW